MSDAETILATTLRLKKNLDALRLVGIQNSCGHYFDEDSICVHCGLQDDF